VVGRAKEIERLHGVLQSAIDGQFGMVLLSGEPGVGKSALVRWWPRW